MNHPSVVDRPIALLEGLNPEQLAAVTLPAEPALILAGAGSGKTRVLTTRVAWLIQTGQLSPGGVMAVTFTNKAAKEMLTRLDAMLAIPVRGMWVGTFHGLCNRFLRAHWKLAALPQGFQILDSSDQLSAVKRIVKAMNLDEERHPPKQLTWAIAGAKDDGLRAKDIEVKDEQSRVLAQVYEAYDAQCQREGVVDFAELMLRTYELLRDNAPLREHYQRRFRHILVDEFQDTNRLQYAWLKMFAGPPEHGCALFCVGDDDQSIYAFRGAQVGNMAAFEREYRVRTVVKLERNYRSYGNILDAANELISRNSRRLGKNLRTEAGPGEPVRVHEAPSDFAEAQWFIEEAQSLHRDGTPRHEIALLYRSNAQSRVMESALFNAHIPYKVYGGLRFFERAEVKHALSYLRLIENPNDDTSFLRVVNFPARGIGSRTIEQLQDAARASGRSLWQSVGSVAGKGGSNLLAFTVRIDAMREQTRGLTLREIIVHMLEASGLVDFYKTDREGKERLENLEELVNAAEAFVTQEGFGKDAVALPVDETGASGLGLYRGEARQGRVQPARRRGRHERRDHRAAAPRSRRRDRRDPLAPGRVPDPRIARGRRQPGAGRPGRGPAHDDPLRQGPRVRLRLHLRPRGRPLPARELVERPRQPGGRAAPDVRRDHAGEEAPLPELLADADAARADALQRQEPLRRRAAGSGAALDHAAQPVVRLGLRARVQPGLGARLGAALDRRHRPRRAALQRRARSCRRRRRTACARARASSTPSSAKASS